MSTRELARELLELQQLLRDMAVTRRLAHEGKGGSVRQRCSRER
jgi:hypothetical protein